MPSRPHQEGAHEEALPNPHFNHRDQVGRGPEPAAESRQYALRDYLVICFPLAVPSLLPRRSWPPAVAFALHDSNKPRRRLSSTQ